MARRKLTRAEKRIVKNAIYRDKVRALRKLNRGFDAASGFNLRDVATGNITPQQKAKITRYTKGQAAELAAIEQGRAVFKRYRRPDHLEMAITESQQSDRFAQQKAAVFIADRPENFQVKLRRVGKRVTFRVTEAGKEKRSIRFQEVYGREWFLSLADDPIEVARQVLTEFPSNFKRFRVMTGKYSSKRLLDRGEVEKFVDFAFSKYGEGSEDWLTGIVGIA